MEIKVVAQSKTFVNAPNPCPKVYIIDEYYDFSLFETAWIADVDQKQERPDYRTL